MLKCSEFRPFHGITECGIFSVLSLECLVVFSIGVLILLMVLDSRQSGILIEVWNAIDCMCFTSVHRIHHVLGLLVWMGFLVYLIRSNQIITCSSIVHEISFLREFFWFVEAIKLPWLGIGSVCFGLFLMYIHTSWHDIRNYHFWASLCIHLLTIK